MKSVPTFTATIYVGTKIRHAAACQSLELGIGWLHDYCNQVGFCVTVTTTKFIYTGAGGVGTTERGGEDGLIIGLINYPVFPVEPIVLRSHAIVIAEGLLRLYKQYRISVVFLDETILIGNDDSH